MFFSFVHVFHCCININLTRQTPPTTRPARNNLSKSVKGTILKSFVTKFMLLTFWAIKIKKKHILRIFNTYWFATVTVVTRTRLHYYTMHTLPVFSLCIISLFCSFFLLPVSFFLHTYLLVSPFLSILCRFETKTVGQEETELPSIIIFPFRVYIDFLVSFGGMNRRSFPLHCP